MSATLQIQPSSSPNPHPLQSKLSFHDISTPLSIAFTAPTPQKSDQLSLTYVSEIVPKGSTDILPQAKVENLKTKGKGEDVLQYKKFPKEEFHSPCMRVTFNEDNQSSVLVKLQTARVTEFYDLVLKSDKERFYVDDWDVQGLKWMNGRILMDEDVVIRWETKEREDQTGEQPEEESADEVAGNAQDSLIVLSVSEKAKLHYITDAMLSEQLDESSLPEDIGKIYADNNVPVQAEIFKEVYETFARTDLRPVCVEDDSMRVLLQVPLEPTAHSELSLHLPQITSKDKVEQILIAYKRHGSEENVFQRISSTLPVYLREKVLQERLLNPNTLQISMEHNARLLTLHENSGKVLGGQVIVVEFNVVETAEETCQVGDQIGIWFRTDSQEENDEDGTHLGSQETHGQTYSRVRFRLPDEHPGHIYFTYLQRGAPDASNWIHRTESFALVPKDKHAENALSESYRARCKELNVKANSLVLKRLKAGTFCNKAGEINLEHDYLSKRGFIPVAELIGASFKEECKHLNLRGNGLRNAEAVLLCEQLRKHVNLESIDLRDNVISSVVKEDALEEERLDQSKDENSTNTQVNPVMKSLRELVSVHNRSIIQLDLRGTKISDEHQKELEAVLQENAQLQREKQAEE
eukprot:CAMPEP_0117443864 /NCGR_PEP_ID=MMETSP0759-20121206/4930_1 /TAXON_ID=63605 /ORGANISM="Percolomonas cosmopolitus, Strain WS" /LENGTH=636 /DNA_ID=CAMNT_0005235883 /DNA_START=147 /DNA_END=2057 /DNA_ORIENTATION=+